MGTKEGNKTRALNFAITNIELNSQMYSIKIGEKQSVEIDRNWLIFL